MKNLVKKVSAGLLVAGVVVAIGSASSSLAVGPVGCFRKVLCLDVWQPVLCPNGQIYSNSCYAYRACQTNCVPAGAI